MQIEMPLLKENNAPRILDIVRAFKAHPLDRDAQRDAVVGLYGDKEEKSVFRGMVIPTLRKLGIIQGWEDMLFLSGNGNLVAAAASDEAASGLRALRAVLLEEDRRHLSLIETMPAEALIDALYAEYAPKVKAAQLPQAEERVERWIMLLSSAGLLKKEGKKVGVNAGSLADAKKDLELTPDKRKNFPKYLFDAYAKTTASQRGIDVVDISELRVIVGESYWKTDKSIVTEAQFDAMLVDLPLNTEKYMLSFGKPMGPEEKLFSLKGSYYRTMSVRMLGGS